jgi:hypothetical protein
MSSQLPLLALSLVLVVVAIVLFGTGHDFAALTALIAAFLVVGGAKRAR